MTLTTRFLLKPLILIPLFLLPFISVFADESKIETITISRANNEQAIQIQLLKPKTGSSSILLYMQDSKCKSSAKQFFKLSQSVSDSVARLYVAKIGESDYQHHHGKCSEKFLSNSSINQRLTDYQQVIDYLRQDAKWWDNKLYIIGEAEGGLIAGLIAAKTTETTKLAILSFGGGMTMSEAWIAALTKSMQSDGKSAADIDEFQNNAKQFFKEKISESSSENTLASNVTYKWWASVVDVRLSDYLVKLDFPIYLAHGTEDTKIPVESAQTVSDLFSTLGKSNLVYNEYTGTIKKVNKCHTANATKTVFAEAVNWLMN